jgi:type I restriction enzyme M protein
VVTSRILPDLRFSVSSLLQKTFYTNGTVPWFTVEDIRKFGRIIHHTAKSITTLALDKTSVKLLPRDTVLLCCTASVGEYAFTEIELTTNQQFNGLVIKDEYSELLDAKFLFYIASTFKTELIRLSGQTSFNFVSVKTLKEIEIPLPPLAVQQEIVAEIAGYQKIIDGARQVVENYKPRIDVRPEWPMVALGEMCFKIQYGSSANLNTESNGFKTFRMNEIVNGVAIDNGCMKCSDIPANEFEKYRLIRGDILFNRTNSFEHVGRTGIFNLQGDYCFASYLIRLCVTADVADPFYINLFMNTASFQIGIKQYASRAIGQANINAQSLRAYKIPLPDLETQRAIVAEIEAEQRLVDGNKELIRRMEAKVKAAIDRVWGEE